MLAPALDHDLTAYRSISLLSTVSKLLEKYAYELAWQQVINANGTLIMMYTDDILHNTHLTPFGICCSIVGPMCQETQSKLMLESVQKLVCKACWDIHGIQLMETFSSRYLISQTSLFHQLLLFFICIFHMYLVLLLYGILCQ